MVTTAYMDNKRIEGCCYHNIVWTWTNIGKRDEIIEKI